MKKDKKQLSLKIDASKAIPLTGMLIPGVSDMISERVQRGEYLFRKVESRLNIMIGLPKNQLN